jgi:hypothetical protein
MCLATIWALVARASCGSHAEVLRGRMFPNVRLLIGAMFASVIALSCGFGVFAAFRVNHDPLSRLPADTAALQLVVDEPAQPPANWGVPLNQGAGEAHAAHPAQVLIGTIVDTPAPASTIAPAAAVTTPAGQTPAAGSQTISSAPAPTATAETTSAKIATAETTGRKAEPAQTAVPQIATKEPAEPSTDPASPAATTVEITGSVPKAATIAVPPLPIARPKPSGPVAHKPVTRRRVVVRRRVVREAHAPAASRFSAGNSTFREPVFQSAPTYGQSETQWRGTSEAAKNSAAANAPAWPSSQ